jgi:PKD repeat protein
MTTPYAVSSFQEWRLSGFNGKQYSGSRSMENNTTVKTWLYTPGIYLEAGKQYRFSHMYRMNSYYGYSPDTMQMAVGTRPNPDSIGNIALTTENPAPIHTGAFLSGREPYIWKNLNFSVPVSGVYFAGLARSAYAAGGGQVDNIEIMEVPATDVQVDSILSPGWYSTSCFLTQLPVTITVKNAGTAAVSNVPVYYKIGTSVYGPETISASIPAGGRMQYTFTQLANLGGLSTTYKLQAFAARSGDTYHANDTSMVDYLVTDTLKPVPYLQTFETGSVSTNSLRYLRWWGVDSVSSLGSANGSTQVARINFGKIPAGRDSIASVPIGPIAPTSFMRFKYRMANSVGNPATMSTLDTIYVTARANCGVPSDTILKIHAGFQTSTAALQYAAPVGLVKFAGSNIRISFVTRKASTLSNFYFDIDSFQVLNLPLADIALLSVDTIQSVVCMGDSTKVSVSLANNGGISASGFPIRISVDGQAPVISYSYPRNLVYTAKDSVRLGTVGFSTPGMHQLKIFVQHTGDGNATNDTLIRRVFAIAPAAAPVALDTALCAANFDYSFPNADSTTTYWYPNNAPNTPAFRASNGLHLTQTDSFYIGTRRHVPAGAGPAAFNPSWSSVANYMNAGIAFDALSDFILDSVGMYPSGTGSLTFDVVSCASCATPTVLKSYTFSFTSANAANKVMLPLELPVKQGRDYAIRLNSISGLTGVVRDFPFTGFPLQNSFGPVTLRNSYTAFGSSYDFYYYFYDWKIKALATCMSVARSKVKASLYSQPKARYQYNQNGAALSFGNNSSGGGTYLWHFGNGDSSNAESPAYTYAAPGTYTVTLIQTNLCGTDSTSKQIEIEGSSSIGNSHILQGVSIYPNPVSAALNISFNSVQAGTVQVQILDATGRILQTSTHTSLRGANTLRQDLAALANGNYWVRISDGEQEARFTIAVLR